MNFKWIIMFYYNIRFHLVHLHWYNMFLYTMLYMQFKNRLNGSFVLEVKILAVSGVFWQRGTWKSLQRVGKYPKYVDLHTAHQSAYSSSIIFKIFAPYYFYLYLNKHIKDNSVLTEPCKSHPLQLFKIMMKNNQKVIQIMQKDI